MKRLFSKLVLSAAVLAGTTGLASAAWAAPSGTFIFKNNATVTVNRTANSFDSSYQQNFPLSIAGGGTQASGYANATSSGVYSGTTIWTDPLTGYGCSFTAVVSYSSFSGQYNFTFSSAKQGGSASTATCSITAARNTSSGTFTAYPVIGGF